MFVQVEPFELAILETRRVPVALTAYISATLADRVPHDRRRYR